MQRFVLPLVALFGLAAVPMTAIAAEEPLYVVRTKSIDGLITDVRQILKAWPGPEGQGKEFTEQIDQFVARLDGLDTKRPLGLYGWYPKENEYPIVLMVPISSEKGFLDLLEREKGKPTRDEEGIWTIPPGGTLPASTFRIANRYAYLTLNDKQRLATDSLMPPEKIFGTASTGMLSGTVYINRLPKEQRQQVLDLIKQTLEKAQKETATGDAMIAFGVQITQLALGWARSVVEDGDEATLLIDLDRKTTEVFIEVTLKGRAGSRLASTIEGVGPSRSLFASLMTPDAVSNMVANMAVPQDLRRSWALMIDGLLKKGVANQQDPIKKDLTARAFKILAPTLQAGELDMVTSCRGPAQNGKFGWVTAIKVKDGDAIDKGLRDLFKDIPESEKAKFKLDVQTIGRVKVHQIDLSGVLTDEMFGTGPAYVAFRSDAAFLTMGEGGLELMKEGLNARPGIVPSFDVAIAPGKFLPLIEKDKEAARLLASYFGKDKGVLSLFRVSVEGGPALKVRLTSNVRATGAIFLIVSAKVAKPPQPPAPPKLQ